MERTGRTNHSVDRSLAAVQLVARAGRSMRFVDLQRRLDVPKGTLHNLLGSLVAAGFLERDSDGYTIGIGAFEVGAAFHRHRSIHDVAGVVLDRLVETFNETVHFGALRDGDVIYVDRRDCTHEVRYVAHLGDRKPAYGTGLGKAMLATLSDEQIVSLYPEELPTVTSRTIRTRDALLHQLAAARRRGYAIEDEESTPGARCIGVAITTDLGLYGISITVPVQRCTLEQLEEHLGDLQEAAREIGSKLSAVEWLNGPGARELSPRAAATDPGGA
ncbi:IclR family transcriptional regulator [Ruania alba]|uniref:Transcriptional regulator, IclR family n=1 Tax=Ruania alba TaxID=648782 RepID=A0A1H5MGA0_9MICO|nr:IclR family transcriptional regulator [Ruania alba]SEE88315.1 transcriptional regulator, IclR family [Ruania alba]